MAICRKCWLVQSSLLGCQNDRRFNRRRPTLLRPLLFGSLSISVSPHRGAAWSTDNPIIHNHDSPGVAISIVIRDQYIGRIASEPRIMKRFADLSERQILAIAFSGEKVATRACLGIADASAVSSTVVAAALAAISWMRCRHMDTPFLAAAFLVVNGGKLVFLSEIAIGSA
jgi:hypothetical protein